MFIPMSQKILRLEMKSTAAVMKNLVAISWRFYSRNSATESRPFDSIIYSIAAVQ